MKLIYLILQKSIKLIRLLLLCAFRKHNNGKIVLGNKTKNDMKILEDCITSAIIIDDHYDEVENLDKLLKSLGIYVEFHNYSGDFHIEGEGRLKNRNLIFMDLMLNGNSGQLRENISIVISLLGKITNGGFFGAYGLVVWTSHCEYVEELKEALSKAAMIPTTCECSDEEEVLIESHLENPPLFVIGLGKSKYNLGNGVYKYDSLKEDLEQALSENKSAYFFVQWNASIERAKNHIANEFYQLGKDYEQRDKRLIYLLFELAKNHTGLQNASDYPYLTADAYKAFDELLYSKLYDEQKEATLPLFEEEMTSPFEKIEEKQTIAAILNRMFFIDDIGLSTKDIVPGNIYRVKKDNSPLITSRKASVDLLEAETKKSNKIKMDNEKRRKNRPANPQLKEEIEPFIPECWDVAIELTPPCDYSQGNRKMARLVGGYIFDIPMGKSSEASTKSRIVEDGCLPKSDSAKEYTIGPIMLENKVRYMVFDYTYLVTVSIETLKDTECYEVCYRAKPKLFAHILQRFSSHAARLGLSNIDLK